MYMHRYVRVKVEGVHVFYPLAPASDPAAMDNYSIQPHLEPQPTYPFLSSQLSQPPLTTTSQPNQALLGQGPPPSQSAAGSNPYRIGVGLGSKKPAYGVSGIASFGPSGQQTSQPMTAPSQPPPAASVQQSFTQVGAI